MMKGEEKGVFDGVKIVSFAWAIVGALTMKYFADYGATVVRIESSTYPDANRLNAPMKDGKSGFNRGGYYNYYNSNLYSMTLNMSHPKGIDIAKRLVAKADVVMENFSTGVMEKWGLDYEGLKNIKSDIIMLRQSGFGSSGPYARLPAFGMTLAGITGIPNFIGWPDRAPLPVGVAAYTDCICPRFATAALIAALDYRNKTGKGQVLDLSQFETGLYFILPAILDYAANHREPSRCGNASSFSVPHNVYRCRGDDRWCAIAVLNDEQWKSFCKVIGKIDLIEDPKYKTFVTRKKNEQDLDAIIGAWTQNFTAEEVMDKMQSAGVPAGVVSNAADIYNDPQLRHRGLFWPMQHPEVGSFTHLGQAFQLSETPARAERPTPCLGEHTASVCTEILGMSDDELVQLMSEGVFE
jgi:benzylsuccinate CoA-transferase BbsF subunit